MHQRSSLLLPGLLAVCLALAACQDDAAKLAEHLERGGAYMEDGSFAEAIIEYKSALQLQPNHPDAHYQLAHAFLRSNKAREGFWELRETVRLDPANTDAQLEFSQLAILAGEHDEALAHMDGVLEKEPTNLRAHLVRAQALEGLGRKDEAIATYEHALELQPDDELPIKALARAYEGHGRLDQAGAQHQRLVELFPTFDNLVSYARFLRANNRGDNQGLEALLTRALEIAEDDDRVRGYTHLSSFYAASDRFDEAVALLEKGIAEGEEDKVRLIYLLARLHSSQGDRAKADQLIERTAQEAPDEPRVHLVLSSYRARNGDLEGALAAAERANELEPESRRAQLQKAEILMELGFKEGREGAAEEAGVLVQKVLAEEPTDPTALFVDAKLKLGQGQVNEAIAGLQATLDSKPNWAQAHYLLGVAYGAKRDFAAARNELGRALEADSSLLDAKNVLTQIHYQLGEWQYAVERGKQYLRERPDDNRARLLVAQSLVRLARFDEAEREIQLIPEDRRDGEVFYALGRMSMARRSTDEARKYLEAAAELEPGHHEILQSLLSLDHSEGKLDASKERLYAALEAAPENGKLHQLAGWVDAVEGRPDEAEARFKKALEVDPEDLTGYERLARFYAARGRLEDTARVYEEAIEVKPDSAQLHHYLGVLYELSGDRDRAIGRYEDAIRYDPKHAEAKNNLAFVYADTGQKLDRALDLAQDAKALLPDNPSVSDTLGWVLFKRGVPSAAISYLKEAEASTAVTDASLGVVRFHLAQAYEASGEPQQAEDALKRSLEALRQHEVSLRARGGDPGPEPEWAAQARAMLDRIASAP